MKKLIYLFLTLLIFACSDDETKKNDLTESNLYGKVRSLTEKEYEPIEKFGEITKGEIIYVNKETYDDKGNMIEISSYNSDGSLAIKYIFEYDDKGNKTERSIYNSDGSLDSKYIYEYEFDNKGNWINVIIYSKGVATGIQEREIVYYTL